jgi:hypothetical protein
MAIASFLCSFSSVLICGALNRQSDLGYFEVLYFRLFIIPTSNDCS